jgi:hypothetical protein
VRRADPAAIEQQITEENADRLRCRLVVEAANGPTTPGAEALLPARGVRVVLDVLANAGGVCVSYFEWVQDIQRYSWDHIELQERLRRQLRAALGKAWSAAEGARRLVADRGAVGRRHARRGGGAAARRLPVASAPMHITAASTRRTIAVLGVTAAAAAGGAPAQASDASLRRVVTQQEKKVAVVADDFAKASEDVTSAVGRDQALTAVTKLKSAVRRQRTAVVKEKATTSKIKRARTQYLAAVDRYSTGLQTFDEGLEAFDPDAPAKAEGLFKKAATQRKAAVARRERARKAIVGRS